MKKVLLILIMVLLTGCFESTKPSKEEIEKQASVYLEVNKDEARFLSIENVRKANGFEKDDKTYVADVQYDIIFKKNQKDIKKDFGSLISAGFRIEFGDFKIGDKATKTMKIKFIKSENGWIIYDKATKTIKG